MSNTDADKPVIGEIKKSEDSNVIVTKASVLKNSKINNFKRIIKRHPVRTAVSILLIIIAVGAVLWVIEINKKPIDPDLLGKPEDPAIIAARVQEAKDDGNLRDEAEKLIVAGNLAQADANYDAAVNNEPDLTKKTKLYLDLSAVYYKLNNLNKTIATANKASALSEDQFQVADWLSRVYEDKGDYAQAAKYYLLAAQWAGSKQNNTGINKSDYEASASRVQGLMR